MFQGLLVGPGISLAVNKSTICDPLKRRRHTLILPRHHRISRGRLAERAGLASLVRLLPTDTLRETRDGGRKAKSAQIHANELPLVIMSFLIPGADRLLMAGAGNADNKRSPALSALT
jgi:hypothetical protein